MAISDPVSSQLTVIVQNSTHETSNGAHYHSSSSFAGGIHCSILCLGMRLMHNEIAPQVIDI